MHRITLGIIALISWCCSISGQPSLVTFEINRREASIFVDGEKWNTKAVSGFDYLDMAQEAGVNTIRTWGINNLNNGQLLDEAHKRGMKVLVGLWFAHNNNGIDYTLASDSVKIKIQYDRITQSVMKYKDHPAILAWGVANEINARNAPIEVWDAVNDVAEFIKNNDPNHPTLTVLAGSKANQIKDVIKHAPSIDILGINSYADTKNVRRDIRKARWKNPFMVTEVGPNGFWESDTTLWGAPIEVNSSIAAQMYIDRYKMVDADPHCIGIFPFKWGSAPKKTPTWLSIFLEDSCKTQAYDELYYLWNNSYPANKSPQLNKLSIIGNAKNESPYLKCGEKVSAYVEAYDPDGDELIYRWEILPEIILTPGIQGSQKITVNPIDGLFDTNKSSITFTCPEKAGPYRLYVYIYDSNQACAYGNMPFYVK